MLALRALFVAGGTLCLWALTVGPAWTQRQTGSVIGMVVDSSGGRLPGASVLLYGTGVLGRQEFTTTETGEFRFPSVPPGAYTMEVSLSGFNSFKREALLVSVGMVARIEVVLEIASMQETVTVTGESPVVDVVSTRVGTNFGEEVINSVPLQRDVYDLFKAVPGMISDHTDYRASGSINGTGTRGMVYNLDGVDQTDPAAAYVGTRHYNLDSFEEVEVITGAMPAEVGTATGGFINIVTKSGGNELSGGASYYYASDALSYGLSDEALDAGIRPGSEGISLLSDLTVQLGGPIKRDEIWFYGTYRRFDNDVKRISFRFEPVDVVEDNDDYFGKLTWQAAKEHRLTFSVKHIEQAQPQFSFIISPQRHPLANWYQISSGPSISTDYQWMLSQSTYLQTRVGVNLKKWDFEIQPESTNPSTFNFATNEWTEAILDGQRHERDRYQWTTSISHFKDDFLGGSHDFKFGFNYNYSFHAFDRRILGGYVRYFTGDQSTFVDFANSEPPYFEEDRNLFDYGFFAQDLWTVSDRLTLTLGLRVDHANVVYPAQQFDASGVFPELQALVPQVFGPQNIPETTLASWTDLSPRLGFSLDLTGDGKTALKGSFARYNEQLYTYNFEWPYSLRRSRHRWADLNGNQLVESGEFGPAISTEGVSAPQYPDTERPHWLEALVDFERELVPNLNFGARFIYKVNNDIYDNVDVGTEGHWFPISIYDAGPDGVRGNGDDVGAVTAYDLEREYLGKNQFVGLNPEGAVRRYKAVEFTGTKRFSQNWQLFSSFVISQAEGNIGNGYIQTQNSPAFNNPNSRINEYGILDLDSTYQFKIGGNYTFPYEISVGGFFTHLTGYPYTRQLRVSTDIDGRPLNVGNITIYAEPLGSRRLSDENLLNISVEKGFTLGGGHRLSLRLDGFNIFNENTVIGQFDLSGNRFDSITRIIPPGYWRIGARYSF